MRRLLPAFLFAACTGPSAPEPEPEPPPAVVVRVASYNTSLFQQSPGRLADRLADPSWEPGRNVAAILQEIRPDIVLLNEVDTDLSGAVADGLRANFLEIGQEGREPLTYAHAFVAPVNTGVPTGFDLDRDGQVADAPGSAAFARDAHGFGTFEGQYGMLVLSRHPIVGSRTFQRFLWASLAEPGWPDDPTTGEAGGWYPPEVKAILRLSSKSHWDLTVDVGGHPLHLLASHPTPPAFDGPERRNVARNNAEVRFWVDYLSAGADAAITDDEGGQGGLGDGSFVILGDLNADPNDGSVAGGAISALLAHPRVSQATPPASRGAVVAASEQGGLNAEHVGDPAHDTADWSPTSTGNLRVDYALPSADLPLVNSGVFWPAADEPGHELLGRSDHHAVWVEVRLGDR